MLITTLGRRGGGTVGSARRDLRSCIPLRTALHLGFVLMTLAASCSSPRGSASGQGQERPTPPETVDAATASSDTEASCPNALPPPRRAAQNVLRAARREVPRVYADIDTRGYTIDGVLSGSFGRSLRRFRFADVRRRAVEACGSEVASLSWIGFLSFPRAPAASIGFSVAFFARTQDGWRLWFRCQPNLPPPNCGLEE